MRVIEGTVDEIVEYELRMGRAPARQEEAPEEEGEAVEVVTSAGDVDDEAMFEIEQHVMGRAPSAVIKSRVMRYLRAALELGAMAETGESVRTRDGLTDYIMVRDDGPRRFGAVAYVKPRNGGLTLRLEPEDVEEYDSTLIKLRQTRDGHQYAVNCPLQSDEAVDLAVELTRKALTKVRA